MVFRAAFAGFAFNRQSARFLSSVGLTNFCLFFSANVGTNVLRTQLARITAEATVLAQMPKLTSGVSCFYSSYFRFRK